MVQRGYPRFLCRGSRLYNLGELKIVQGRWVSIREDEVHGVGVPACVTRVCL